MEDEARERLREAAFVGWQIYLTAPDYSTKPKRKIAFDKYLKNLNLAEKGHAPAQMTKEESIKAAEEADARVRQAFKRRPVQA